MLAIVAVVLAIFGTMMRRTTTSKEWLLVANMSLMLAGAFLLYGLLVVVLFI